MAVGISNFSQIYQTYYPDDQLPYLVPSTAVVLNMALGGSTDGQVSGNQIDMPWLFDEAAGVSQTFSVAQAAAGNAPSALRPTVYLSQAYKVLSFLDKDEIMSRGEASYGDLMEVTMKGVRNNFLSNIDLMLRGNGSGNVASFTWASATPTVLAFNSIPTGLTSDTTGAVLGSPVGPTAFTKGDSVVITSTNPKDGTAPTTVAGPFTVTGLSGLGNTITISANPGLTNGNVYGVAKAGNTLGFNTSMLTPGVIGLDAYNPYGGVSATDNFLNQNRSTAIDQRVAGSWGDFSTNFTVEQAIKRCATLMTNSGVEPGGFVIGMFPTDMDALDLKLQTQQRYTSTQVGVFYHEGIALNTSAGRVSVIADPHQAQGFFRVYAPGAMQLMYRDGLPHVATLKNGQTEQWGQNYDGRETRLRAYFQMRVRDPRKLAIGKLPNIS